MRPMSTGRMVRPKERPQQAEGRRENDTPELRLWREVLRLVVDELRRNGGTRTEAAMRPHARRRALAYINTRDFELVVNLAGGDPERFRAELERAGYLNGGEHGDKPE